MIATIGPALTWNVGVGIHKVGGQVGVVVRPLVGWPEIAEVLLRRRYARLGGDDGNEAEKRSKNFMHLDVLH
jgi:hypothetical protein